MIDILQVVCQ
ncbi:hypothetical protein Z5903 [Escherichia coli O157:H7 str. EDL933]|uniref:Uncharacterized protein n=1 Tax=Escherichia coli O157:H7 TaxID=83334 RepID=Q8X4E5_ECO57|nr:hypothetical protein Z5903 [Escherichia coli O157:H7 str. EDL933]